VNLVECTIPPDVTIEQWRRLRRATVPTRGNPRSLVLAFARRVRRHGEQPCEHLHGTASRYDHAARRLELLLTCPVCKTEKVIHSLAYEPRFEPSGATVHPLRRRDGKTPHAVDRAA
jgi:ribosomal protein L44E